MSFVFQCPFCNQELEAEEEWIGQETKCPKCAGTIRIINPNDKGVQNLRAMEEEPSSQNSLTRPNMCNNNSTSIKFEEKALKISKWSKYLGILGWPIVHLIGGIVLGFNSEMDRMEAMTVEGMFYWLSIFCVLGSLISGMIALGKNSGEAKKYNLSYSKTLTFKNARFGIICSIIAIIFIVRGFCRM